MHQYLGCLRELEIQIFHSKSDWAKKILTADQESVRVHG